MRVLLASGNRHKFEEMSAAFSDIGISLFLPDSEMFEII